MGSDDKQALSVTETPVQGDTQTEVWGSDVMAATLRLLEIPYVALNPGASYRGLHDSIVNYNGNQAPQMLLCLHEESAVSIAQGYAKASDRMMGAIVHSNVGLMHASMAIFNAWCDRIPMLVMGATGPWDAAKRRPWIDWIHTTSDQGALVRDYTKWDNQPGSVPAAVEALLRASQIANTAPRGPTYVNFDAALQELKFGPMPTMPDPKRYLAPPPVLPAPDLVEQAAKLLSGAKRPLILAGRSRRSEKAWRERIALAEKLQAPVLTDIKLAAAFPTNHPLHILPPAGMLTPDAIRLIREADVILSLDWVDLGGSLKFAAGDREIGAKVIHVSPDQHSHRGWSMDHCALPSVDVYMVCEPEGAVPLLTDAVTQRPTANFVKPSPILPALSEDVSIRQLADALNSASKGMDVTLIHLPIGWNGAYRDFNHPLDHLGGDGGGGIGSGPGLSVGAALALKGSGRVPVSIIGDGNLLMGVTALWTAAHYQIPLLILVANNRSFFNDELHQERVAKTRSRPVENRWIGQRISGPDIDLAAMARAQGVEGIGPVESVTDLRKAVQRGLQIVRAGGTCVVDVRVLPGYDVDASGTSSAETRKT